MKTRTFKFKQVNIAFNMSRTYCHFNFSFLATRYVLRLQKGNDVIPCHFQERVHCQLPELHVTGRIPRLQGREFLEGNTSCCRQLSDNA